MSDETHLERHRRLVREWQDLRHQVNVIEQRVGRWTDAELAMFYRLYNESLKALEQALQEEQS